MKRSNVYGNEAASRQYPVNKDDSPEAARISSVSPKKQSVRKVSNHEETLRTGLSDFELDDLDEIVTKPKTVDDWKRGPLNVLPPELKLPHDVDKFGFLTSDSEPTLCKEISTSSVQEAMRVNKWVRMLSNWEYYTVKHQRVIRDRCRKGIPDSLRGSAWFHITGAFKWMEKRSGVYDELIKVETTRWDGQIEKDLSRTLPTHYLFKERSSPGQEGLYEVLQAYCVYNPTVGYCQAMAPIVAVFLLYMTREQAFWMLVRFCDVYMNNYFTERMESIQVDALIFGSLLRVYLPEEHEILRKVDVTPLTFVQNWFFCIYTRTLPWNIVLRIWDIYVFEGKWSLFSCGIVLLKYAFLPLTRGAKTNSHNDFEVLDAIMNFDSRSLNEEYFIRKTFEVKLTKDQKRSLVDRCTSKFKSGASQNHGRSGSTNYELARKKWHNWGRRNKRDRRPSDKPSKSASPEVLPCTGKDTSRRLTFTSEEMDTPVPSLPR